MENGDFTMGNCVFYHGNGDFTMENCVSFTMENGNFTMKFCDFTMKPWWFCDEKFMVGLLWKCWKHGEMLGKNGFTVNNASFTSFYYMNNGGFANRTW